MTRQRLLITGGAGLIGGVLRAGLADTYDIRVVDRVHCEDGADSFVADMTNLDEVLSAFEDVDAVVDLAAFANAEISWDDVLANNIPATRNALEAARCCGVRIVVYASSNFITGSYDADEPYRSILAGEYSDVKPGEFPKVRVEDAIRPDSAYAVGKAFGEAAGRHYAEKYAMSVYALRIGTVNAENRPLKPRHFAKWLSHRDLCQLVDRCVSAPHDGGSFRTYYGVSGNTWRIWSIDQAKADIGYEPVDDAEAWR